MEIDLVNLIEGLVGAGGLTWLGKYMYYRQKQKAKAELAKNKIAEVATEKVEVANEKVEDIMQKNIDSLIKNVDKKNVAIIEKDKEIGILKEENSVLKIESAVWEERWLKQTAKSSKRKKK